MKAISHYTVTVAKLLPTRSMAPLQDFDNSLSLCSQMVNERLYEPVMEYSDNLIEHMEYRVRLDLLKMANL